MAGLDLTSHCGWSSTVGVLTVPRDTVDDVFSLSVASLCCHGELFHYGGQCSSYLSNCFRSSHVRQHYEKKDYQNCLRVYCKTLIFCRILISRFSCAENLLHFNFADFPVNFIKQFVSCFFVPLTNVIIEFIWYYCLHYIIPRTLHIISRKC